MSGAVASFLALPGGAELFALFSPEGFVDAFGDGAVLAVPREGGQAVDGAVRAVTEADSAAGEGGIGVSKGLTLLDWSCFRRSGGSASGS